MSKRLAADRRAYRRHQREYLARSKDEGASVVLLHRGVVVGFFASEIDAAREGIARFGSDPFYVRDLDRDRRPAMVASNFPV